MVKTEVSARVSSWRFFLNRSRPIGKRGNIPFRERPAAPRKWRPNRRSRFSFYQKQPHAQ
jgi:hypothetical protein